MASYRPESVGRNIQIELSKILRQESRDPRLQEVTITGVKMSQDLRTAKVFISVLDETKTDVLESLKRASAFLRRQIGQRVRLRHVPELFFAYDESLVQGARIDQLLSQLDS